MSGKSSRRRDFDLHDAAENQARRTLQKCCEETTQLLLHRTRAVERRRFLSESAPSISLRMFINKSYILQRIEMDRADLKED